MASCSMNLQGGVRRDHAASNIEFREKALREELEQMLLFDVVFQNGGRHPIFLTTESITI